MKTRTPRYRGRATERTYKRNGPYKIKPPGLKNPEKSLKKWDCADELQPIYLTELRNNSTGGQSMTRFKQYLQLKILLLLVASLLPIYVGKLGRFFRFNYMQGISNPRCQIGRAESKQTLSESLCRLG